MKLVRGVATVLLGVAAITMISGCGTIDRALGHDETQTGERAGSQAGIGVNGYLWRASLDTLAFMPLETADPWGGIINYGWRSTAENPNERIKATVYILDSRLRADALNVTVNREVRDAAGQWVEAQVSTQTETDLENAILTRARQLRLAGVTTE